MYYLIIGKKSYSIVNSNVIYTGTITDERVMVLAYSAADYFVLPSREDNLPNTMLESISCGTPVIAFPIGDCTEILEEANCGLIADEISTESLEKAMKKAIEIKSSFEQEKLLSYSTNHFNASKQISKYVEIYLNLL